MENKETKALEALLVLIWLPLHIVMSAFVVSTLWNWHIAPVFGVTYLTKVQAAMMCLTINTIRMETTKSPDPDYSPMEKIGLEICAYVLALLIGWIGLQMK